MCMSSGRTVTLETGAAIPTRASRRVLGNLVRPLLRSGYWTIGMVLVAEMGEARICLRGRRAELLQFSSALSVEWETDPTTDKRAPSRGSRPSDCPLAAAVACTGISFRMARSLLTNERAPWLVTVAGREWCLDFYCRTCLEWHTCPRPRRALDAGLSLESGPGCAAALTSRLH